jgi:hypothetical protein
MNGFEEDIGLLNSNTTYESSQLEVDMDDDNNVSADSPELPDVSRYVLFYTVMLDMANDVHVVGVVACKVFRKKTSSLTCGNSDIIAVPALGKLDWRRVLTYWMTMCILLCKCLGAL